MLNHPHSLPSSSPSPIKNSISHSRQSQHQRRIAERSFSHLLGFTLPPRSPHSSHSLAPNRRPIRRHHSNNSYHLKDCFVHANYRFVLNPTGDYTVHFADPDIRFNWPDILQVIVNPSTSLPASDTPPPGEHASEPSPKPTCPICLSPPTAPRMTRCGHIFCYPCLLHYLELSGDAKGQGRKCPVCWETVLKKDLKSVRWLDLAPDATTLAGQLPGSVTFRLLERPKFSTLALPRSPTWPSPAVEAHHSPWHFTPDALAFAKFVLASPEYMAAELARDLDELHAELVALSKWSEDAEDLGIMFVRAAEVKVREQIHKAGLLKTQYVMTARKRALRAIAEAARPAPVEPGLAVGSDLYQAQLNALTTTDEDEPASVASATTAGLLADLPSELDFFPSPSNQLADLALPSSAPLIIPSVLPKAPSAKPTAPSTSAPKTRKNINPPEPSSSTYRFYQAASGEPVFLSPLDIRILLAKYGSYDHFPDTITLQIEGSSEGRMSEELRRRCRYLSHLPTGSEVRIVEADLDSYLVDDGSLAAAMRQRRAKRREKMRKEDKAKARCEQVEQSQQWAPSLPLKAERNGRGRSGDDEPLGGLVGVLGDDGIGSQSPQLAVKSCRGVSHSEPSGSRTVWGTYIPSSRNPAAQEEMDKPDDAWASLVGRPAARTRRGGKAELNVDDSEGSESEKGQPRGGGKKKNRKQNKVVINISGGRGGRGF